VAGRNVLVQGGGGAVGSFAIGFARQAGAQVFATVRSPVDEQAARGAGAHHVMRTDHRSQAEVLAEVYSLAPAGVQHIVEVAFDVNVDVDMHMLAVGGAIAAYATQDARPAIPFWELLFKNARLFLLGSDDFLLEDKLGAAAATNALLIDGWKGLRIDRTFSLEDIAAAHEHAGAHPPGRVVLRI
jgi:NADPH2:quinone reductase